MLDSLVTTTLVKRELLDGVKDVTFRYMDVSRQWRDQFPPQAQVGAQLQNLRMRPIAVEVTLDLEDYGKIKRIFEVPT